MCEARNAGGAARTIDPCLANEILRLNLAGVVTVSSCCGHGKSEPFLMIRGTHVRSAAQELGYSPAPWMQPELRLWKIRPASVAWDGVTDDRVPRNRRMRRLTQTQRHLRQHRRVLLMDKP